MGRTKFRKRSTLYIDSLIPQTDRAKKMQSGGCAVISDEEVFGCAVHYYDEDDIKVEKTSASKTEVKEEVP